MMLTTSMSVGKEQFASTNQGLHPSRTLDQTIIVSNLGILGHQRAGFTLGLIVRAEVELGDWGPALWVRGFGYKGSSVRLCWARGELSVNSRDSLHFFGGMGS